MNDTHDPEMRDGLGLPRREAIAVAGLFATAFLLRLVFAFSYRVDSDEPQHLHVVWGWVHGLMPYRDVFDNHMPLFHWLCTPLYLLIGDHPSVFFLMRLAMIPLYAVLLGCVYRLGRALFSARVGAWAAALTGLFPPLFLCAAEFRSDDLWVVLTIGAIVVLVRGPVALSRGLCAGLLLGLATAVSMKTTLVLFALACAGAGTWLTTRPRGDGGRWAVEGLVMLLPILLGPALVAAFFVLIDSWGAFVHGVFLHNVIALRSPLRMLLFPVSLPLIGWAAGRIRQGAPDPATGTRRVFTWYTGAVYFSALNTLWPLLSLETFLPFYPLLVLFLTPRLLGAPAAPAGHEKADECRGAPRAAWAFAAAEIIALLLLGAPWRDAAEPEIAMLRDVLRLTDPSECVMDLKGELVFRPRAFYYPLETISLQRMYEGRLPDTIPESIIAARACVAVPDDPDFPPRTRAFLLRHFLPAGHLRVAGQVLDTSATPDGILRFIVRIPAPYTVLSTSGTAPGDFDGRPSDGRRFLDAGPHGFRPAHPGNGRLVLVWSRAVERGFRPAALTEGCP